ncbi:putative membrane-anchored protein [Rhizobium sp. SG_E_25_P2]|jgi:uncharacterized membrane-anchored protein|uniref:hypothetical protein n=1 Tax=Rhizobium sp. SG_E_25_P2 TaxID=2879942 RepID=UPI0024733F08|nr:hypothetical protein [Rhizobium sp. SG_E_25_P2]MDH6267897.1 putative membrane-anchored protein [Rhizobium sp. SG_E_25_P2]
MFRLVAMIYVLVATVMMGTAVTALLSVRMSEGWQIGGAALAGAVLAIPVAWLVGRQIYNTIGRRA